MAWSGKVPVDGVEYELATICVTQFGGTWLITLNGEEVGVLDTTPQNEIHPSPRGGLDRETVAKIGSEARRLGMI